MAKKAKSEKSKDSKPQKVKKTKVKKDKKPGLLRRFFNYFREARQELKKVTWPSRKEAIKLTFAVIVFTTIFSLVTVIFDLGLEKVAERLFL